jgi:ECF sigma factor
MRRYLIDEWRKRPKGELAPLHSGLFARRRDLDLEIEVDRLLGDLAQVNSEWCDVVELKHFLGLTDEETARIMNLTLRTMQKRWRDARGACCDQMRQERFPQAPASGGAARQESQPRQHLQNLRHPYGGDPGGRNRRHQWRRPLLQRRFFLSLRNCTNKSSTAPLTLRTRKPSRLFGKPARRNSPSSTTRRNCNGRRRLPRFRRRGGRITRSHPSQDQRSHRAASGPKASTL